MICADCSWTLDRDSAGQRLTKVEGGTTTRFVYDGAKVVLERDSDDETQVRYTHEGGSLYSDLLSQRRDGASYDYLLDGLASVKQVVDSSQAVENSYSYEAFGQPTVGQSDVANPYLFVGGYGVQWESTPSLYFMQARYYGPSVGRFISEDPYGGAPQDPMSLHRYLYCSNSPVSYIYASGMQIDPNAWVKNLVNSATDDVYRSLGFIFCVTSCLAIGFTPGPCGRLLRQLWDQTRAVLLSIGLTTDIPKGVTSKVFVDMVARVAGKAAVGASRIAGWAIPSIAELLYLNPCTRECQRKWVDPPGYLTVLIPPPAPPFHFWDPAEQ